MEATSLEDRPTVPESTWNKTPGPGNGQPQSRTVEHHSFRVMNGNNITGTAPAQQLECYPNSPFLERRG